MPFSDLVERHGGQMLCAFAQKNYIQARHLPQHSEGVCAALSTMWVAKRAQGRDFYKYAATNDGRNLVAQLQSREEGLKHANNALSELSDRFGQNVAQLKSYQGPDREKKLAMLERDVSDLEKSSLFLQQEVKKQHQYRSEYIEKETGLRGNIDQSPVVADAVRDVTRKEGYVLFGMNGAGKERKGHTLAMYHSPRHGVRFFDPNFGEAYFEDHTQFEVFLRELAKSYAESLGGMKSAELITFDDPLMPKSPEDAEMGNSGYLPLNLAFPDIMTHATAEETAPLLANTDE